MSLFPSNSSKLGRGGDWEVDEIMGKGTHTCPARRSWVMSLICSPCPHSGGCDWVCFIGWFMVKGLYCTVQVKGSLSQVLSPCAVPVLHAPHTSPMNSNVSVGDPKGLVNEEICLCNSVRKKRVPRDKAGTALYFTIWILENSLPPSHSN